MFTFRDIQNCEGYYYNTRTGEILRNVGPGEARCWSGEDWRETAAAEDPGLPEFELVTPDILTPIESVQRLVEERCHRAPPEHLRNRQTARQPDGSLVVEESPTRRAPARNR